MPVKVIAGLGNPGPKYEKTRHNVGFLVADALAERCGAQWLPEKGVRHALSTQVILGDYRVALVKPANYMNHSGRVLQAFCRYFRVLPEEVVAIYDDITLEPGRAKISIQGGDGGHNGVTDLLTHLGQGFIRFRIGIGPKNHPEMDLADFVLGKLPKDHLDRINEEMPTYLDGLISLVEEGPVYTMNHFNKKR